MERRSRRPPIGKRFPTRSDLINRVAFQRLPPALDASEGDYERPLGCTWNDLEGLVEAINRNESDDACSWSELESLVESIKRNGSVSAPLTSQSSVPFGSNVETSAPSSSIDRSSNKSSSSANRTTSLQSPFSSSPPSSTEDSSIKITSPNDEFVGS
ncbi:hypothetical protein SISSUDRAFT_1065146 [Sistotremastrum suecicum HHB10207 ss-3]|uniref:Uncharacterized protein n=1 Tax=Sistotremastrum suecicum HHB10207 ss-3 TaxID=1314776 RepID=A0A165ZUI8_9AGAM|nr:hypothetical protein SISSUDRAFT_1065146 [Sistotremastrum suecicum HHB10207 ss-3]